ncbi:MAG: LysM peptidoglycan-binding domain-containing protein [Alicyclobacillus sp.]|nr:LysM peptidoglycan-binding domain-containing protein [Alicyclobacillus sp.]
MSDVERAPVIRLNLDQEVFLEAVREGDTFEDATVATEVTSFDRNGDAYVLEGAVVFAGVLVPPGETDRRASPAWDPASVGATRFVQHRLPFLLRVPVRAQPRGLVNVASRITQWNIQVAAPQWLRVLADLQISGLNGQQGYHFQCGAQEAGDWFPEATPSTDRTVVPEGAEQPARDRSMPAESPTAEAAEALAVQPAAMEWRGRGREAEGPSLEDLSAARAGHGGEDATQAAPTAAASAAAGEVDLDTPWPVASAARTTQEAADTPPRHTPTEPHEAGEAATSVALTDDAGASSATRPAPAEAETDVVANSAASPAAAGPEPRQSAEAAESVWMEFEHQLTPAELAADLPESDGTPAREEPTVVWGASAAAASAQLPSAGFQALVPGRGSMAAGGGTGTVAQPTAEAAAGDLAAPAAVGEAASRSEGNHGPGASSLWSFVDFNAPETKYTLRFVIVMEEETLDMVAERLGCSKTDLMRVNHLATETVYPGQSLRVPVPAAVRG